MTNDTTMLVNGGRAALRRLLACGLLAAVAAAGCSGDAPAAEQRRRDLLKPRDYRAKFVQAEKARQVYDAEGELLESDQTVAEIVLPKGITLDRQFDENQWIYRSTEVPADKLESYFSRRLMSKTVEHGNGSVVFDEAVPVRNPRASRVRVQVESLRGSSTASSVYIRQSVPFKPKIPLDEVEAQLRAAREHAD